MKQNKENESSSVSSLDAAIYYASIGWQVFPVHTFYNGSCTCGDPSCGSVAKHPLVSGGVHEATKEEEQIKQYFSGDYDIANVGIACGEKSGVIVLDVDNVDDLKKLEAENEPLPKTWTVITGSGGLHYYFQYDDRCRFLKNATKIAGAIDVRTDGGYIIGPPSIHESGERYTWTERPTKKTCKLAKLPSWLLDLMPKHDDEASDGDSVTALQTSTSAEGGSPSTLTVEKASTIKDRAELYLREASPAISGESGHDRTWTVICRLCELFPELDDGEVLDVLDDWNSKCEPPWKDSELKHKIKDAKKHVRRSTPATQNISTVEEWPTLGGDAFYGLAGDIVKVIAPHSECDEASLLITLLSAFGVEVGRNPFFQVEGDKHYANIFAVLCGKSSRARKGTSLGRIMDIGSSAFKADRVSGLSSGEGLIYALRDCEIVDEGDGKFHADDGKEDKRLLVTESEFARTLKVMKRESNTLSAILRDCWDRGQLHSLTKGSPLQASDVHVGIVGHITTEELRRTIADNELSNGFANRFLWTMVRRSKLLPEGSSPIELGSYRNRLAMTCEKASIVGRMRRSAEASKLWCDVYEELVTEKPSLTWDFATSRAEAQVLRLSMLYALLDGSATIEVPHLRAALALWRYCDDSCRIIFGDSSLANKIRQLINTKPGIMRSEIRHALSHDIKTLDFDAAIDWLLRRKDIVIVPCFEKRSAERFYPAIKHEASSVESGDEPMQASQVEEVEETAKEEEKTDSSSVDDVASIAELLEWKNKHAIRFERRSDGFIYVQQRDLLKVSPAIRKAIENNQSLLNSFVASVDGEEYDMAISEPELFKELMEV